LLKYLGRIQGVLLMTIHADCTDAVHQLCRVYTSTTAAAATTTHQLLGIELLVQGIPDGPLILALVSGQEGGVDSLLGRRLLLGGRWWVCLENVGVHRQPRGV
jgi:hypothetical protein